MRNQQQVSRRLSRVYQLLISGLLICVFIGFFIYYISQLFNTVNDVNLHKAVAEFHHSAVAIHGKWLAHKQDTITLEQVSAQMQVVGQQQFVVNRFGWPTGLEGDGAPCQGLFARMQGQGNLAGVSVKPVWAGQALVGCEFLFNERAWFRFDVHTGQVAVTLK